MHRNEFPPGSATLTKGSFCIGDNTNSTTPLLGADAGQVGH